MAHTYANNLIHCIFSTKECRADLTRDRRPDLYAYFGGIARSEGFALIAAGGTANHVHLLIVLPATVSLATAVQKLKGSSSRWLGKGFAWQEGYGAFSVSPSQVPAVKRYISNQEIHHRTRTFDEEFTEMLRKCGIEYDPRHVFG
jgi:putative transposase